MIRRLGVIVVVTGLLLSAPIGQAASAEANNFNEPVVCLDPGHQLYGNNELEPVGPGAKEMKAKVTSGTRGVKTKKPEYVVTLEASLLMKAKLEALGYQVRMTRDTHEVDLSNKERADVCNQARADLAVRVHADGDGSPKTKGISLLYPAWSEWSQLIFAQSKEAAQDVLNEVLAATGAASRGIVPRSDLSGFNWSEVPTILVEMGFMTNPEEDEKLSDASYLDQLTQGVVNGINSFMATQTEGTEREQQGRIYLPETARLYESRNGKMIRTALSLTSQTVQTSAVWGNWRKVSTWAGDKWVDAGQMPIEVQKAERLLELTKDTAMYRSPLDKAPVGGLTPQKVQAHEQWNGWYSIDTWMGRVWIQADVQ
ncbi:N-acetylmuramoyl-L-alanine amidase [Paenibacillus elgii]|uniref:N-acetylmuramoyl-L-alanine amidase n=1 Tax=Paenibacillus elgii TaxID=189691 RepID=UPI0013D3384D|nr:N-acetylmuramoyl-L-alanine amidase [Paenibacillus elgii]